LVLTLVTLFLKSAVGEAKVGSNGGAAPLSTCLLILRPLKLRFYDTMVCLGLVTSFAVDFCDLVTPLAASFSCYLTLISDRLFLFGAFEATC